MILHYHDKHIPLMNDINIEVQLKKETIEN